MRLNHTQKLAILIVIITIGVLFLWEPFTEVLSNPEKTRIVIESYGSLAPLAFIIISFLQVLFAPIPGQLTGVIGGYVFGVVKGTIYSMIGVVIGSVFAFYLGRKLGRPFVEKKINEKTLNKFDKIIKEKGTLALFLIFVLPIFPDDILCYVAGLTRMKTRNFIIVTLLGRLPGMFTWNLIGAGIYYNDIRIYILVALGSMLILFLYIKRKKVERIIFGRLK